MAEKVNYEERYQQALSIIEQNGLIQSKALRKLCPDAYFNAALDYIEQKYWLYLDEEKPEKYVIYRRRKQMTLCEFYRERISFFRKRQRTSTSVNERNSSRMQAEEYEERLATATVEELAREVPAE